MNVFELIWTYVNQIIFFGIQFEFQLSRSANEQQNQANASSTLFIFIS